MFPSSRLIFCQSLPEAATALGHGDMAGAGQPWYMPATWPLGHLGSAITKDPEEKPPKPSAAPYLDLMGNLTAIAAAARSWTLAYLCIFYLPQKFGLDAYPAFGPAKVHCHCSFSIDNEQVCSSGVATGLGCPHLLEECGGYPGHLRLLGLVSLLLPASRQAPQIQD